MYPTISPSYPQSHQASSYVHSEHFIFSKCLMVHEGYHWDKSTINPQFSYVLISVHIQIPWKSPWKSRRFTSPPQVVRLHAIFLHWHRSLLSARSEEQMANLQVPRRTAWFTLGELMVNVNPGLINSKRLFNWEGTFKY